MPARVLVFLFGLFLLFTFSFSLKTQNVTAQSGRKPQPSPTSQDDTVKIFTEEVRLPVIALDDYERYDPTLVVDDVLVLEDGVPQQVKSVQRIPASVLFLLCSGGETNPAMRTTQTQLTALTLLTKLHQGDNFAVIQFNSKVETLQNWTTDLIGAGRVIKSKMKSGNGTNMVRAFNAAADIFAKQPFGNRHIILITDGVEMPGGRLGYEEKMKALGAFNLQENKAEWDKAVKKLMGTQATIHVISYTAFAREVYSNNNKKNKPVFGSRPPRDVTALPPIDPTVPPGTQRGGTMTPTMGVSIRFDPQMKRLQKAYENATRTSERKLSTLADETGTKIFLPTSNEEMFEQVNSIARDIGAQYVVTYSPKKPITSANIGEYRTIQVNPRRIGLKLRSRRGYVVVLPPEK